MVDVGSAGGLHERWRPFAAVLSAILFEPREGRTASGALGRGQTRTYPVGLSDRAGEADLHVTALANMSSLLKPDAELFGRYRKKGADARVVAIAKVAVDRLDALAEADGFAPDVLKVDTQGSELLVLMGAEKSLASVILAEVEVSFLRRYLGQPLFAEIETWMTDRGFELLELHKVKRYRAANSLGIRQPLLGHGQRSGRVAYGDALFLRRQDLILEAARSDGGATILKAMVALIAYGKADHAAALFETGRELLPVERAEVVQKALAVMKRWRFLPPLTSLIPRR